MLNDDNAPLFTRIGEAELPRLIQVPVGIVLGLFTLFCALALVDILLLPGKQSSLNPILAVVIELLLLLPCLWVLEKCWRLVTGRKKRGGLLSPTALRVVAYCLLILPVAGLFTGLLPRNGSYRGFSGVDVSFRVLWAACIRSKAGGNLRRANRVGTERRAERLAGDLSILRALGGARVRFDPPKNHVIR